MAAPISEQGSLPNVAYEASLEIPTWDGMPAEQLDETALAVRKLELDEGLGAPFRLTITLRSQDPRFDPTRLAGAEFHLRIVREDAGNVGLLDGRYVHGVVMRATYLGSFADAYEVRLEVGPALCLLDTAPRSRIFQDLSVVEVVQQVLGAVLGERNRNIDATRLASTYPPRDYCVQYRETDLAFVTRILAEEGITFLFDHAGEYETMVLIDHNDAFGSAGQTVDRSAARAPMAVPMADGDGAGPDLEVLNRLERHHDVYAAASQVERYDWKLAPQPGHRATVEPEVPAPWQVGQVYEHLPTRLQEADRGAGAHIDGTVVRAANHVESRALAANVHVGSGNVVGMAAGSTFEVDGHPDTGFNRAYYCLRATHRADCPEVERGAGAFFSGENYVNDFVCAVLDLPFAPAPTLRTPIHGPQTATVVGPRAEEINTDRFGRIQVRMHWDREHRDQDGDTSCWLRVVQPWAGAGWGAMFIPRVGMEVLVTFLDGDPDRPLCIGSVYNAGNTPPYPLPDERTKSTIRTRSTPGGDGYNELRFDDAAGAEEVFIHAQKDFNEVVGNAHTTRVGGSQTISVEHNQSVAIGGSRDITITGTHTMKVDGAPEGSPPPDFVGHALEVTGDIKQTATKTVLITADTSITLQCGSSKIEITATSISLSAGGGASLVLDPAVLLASANLGVSVGMDDAGVMTMASKMNGTFTMDSEIAMETAMGSKMLLTEDISITAGSGATVAYTDAIAMDGASITATGGQGRVEIDGKVAVDGTTVTLAAGASSLKLEPAQGTINAPSVTVQGAAQVSIGAPNVKIN